MAAVIGSGEKFFSAWGITRQMYKADAGIGVGLGNPELRLRDAGWAGKRGCQQFSVTGNLSYRPNRHPATSVLGSNTILGNGFFRHSGPALVEPHGGDTAALYRRSAD